MPQAEAPDVLRSEWQFVDPKTGRLTASGALFLDQLWRQISAGFPIIPCIATGANDITLVPRMQKEGARTYADHIVFGFVAAADSTDAVTAHVEDAGGAEPLATVKVYISGGSAQANTGDVLQTRFYLAAFVQALDGGAGGLVLIN